MSNIERTPSLAYNVAGHILDRTLFFDMVQYPVKQVLVDSISSVKSHYLLRRVLVAVDLLSIHLHTQIDMVALVRLMNRLVTFRVGSLNYLGYLRVLNDPVVDVQHQGLTLHSVEFGYYAFYLHVF